MLPYVTLTLKRYADFNGRSSRSEYWYFHFAILVAFCGIVLSMAIFSPQYREISDFNLIENLKTIVELVNFVALIVLGIGSIIPSFAVTVRRFHDQDKSGWFALVHLVPYLGSVLVAIFMCVPGTEGPNGFGEAAPSPPDPSRRLTSVSRAA